MTDIIPIRFSPKFLEKFGNAVADWWNSRWKKTVVVYDTGNGEMKDPRDLLNAKFEPTPELQSFLDSIKSLDNDSKAYKIHRWILKDLGMKYKSDSEIWHKTEYWQTPQQSLSLKSGDCEDFSLLWLKITEIAGIPSYRCKIYCGDTDGGGHAYPCYLSEEGNRWVSMDLTYYAKILQIEYRAAVQNIRYYGRVWFSFNRSAIFAQHDTQIILGDS